MQRYIYLKSKRLITKAYDSLLCEVKYNISERINKMFILIFIEAVYTDTVSNTKQIYFLAFPPFPNVINIFGK